MRLKKNLEQMCPKNQCEICGIKEPKILQRHHIIERTDLNTSNHPYNLAVLCPNCHNKNHAGLIKIIGVFPSTANSGRLVIYINEKGECSVPGMENAESYFKPSKEQMKIYYKE